MLHSRCFVGHLNYSSWPARKYLPYLKSRMLVCSIPQAPEKHVPMQLDMPLRNITYSLLRSSKPRLNSTFQPTLVLLIVSTCRVRSLALILPIPLFSPHLHEVSHPFRYSPRGQTHPFRVTPACSPRRQLPAASRPSHPPHTVLIHVAVQASLPTIYPHETLPTPFRSPTRHAAPFTLPSPTRPS